MVSPMYIDFGETFASSLVLEFPPNESFKKNVSFESLNGICFFFFPAYAREEITWLNVRRDLFMLQPSFSLSPYTFVSFILSLPAKSTRCSLLLIVFRISSTEDSMLRRMVNIV